MKNWIRFICAFTLTIAGLAPAMADSKVYVSTSKGCYMANDKPVRTYFWSGKSDFGNAFSSNPAAQAEYDQYNKLMTVFPYLNWGALGLALSYGIVSNDHGVYDDGIFWGLFLVPWLSGLFVAGHAHEHLNRAINLYNGVEPDMAGEAPGATLMTPRERSPQPVTVCLFNYQF